ncbi:DUF350 domain-containing protein [archaeon]|nr:DUF350 domain-containing protein [archaeon]
MPSIAIKPELFTDVTLAGSEYESMVVWLSPTVGKSSRNVATASLTVLKGGKYIKTARVGLLGDWMTLVDSVVFATLFTVLGVVIGFIAMLIATVGLPALINKLTPDLDEGKEIRRGNIAVAQYFGQVVGASIIGVAIIIGSAIIAGIHG